jgi:carboxylesterase type B
MLDVHFAVTHSAEIPYVFGAVVGGTPSAKTLSANMVDYWISFATGLDPNDGLGTPSESRHTFSEPLTELFVKDPSGPLTAPLTRYGYFIPTSNMLMYSGVVGIERR